MSSKLTLSVDQKIIEEAKKYAKLNGRSLSNIVEEYLKSLVAQKKERDDFEMSPAIRSLYGSVKLSETDKDKDYKLMVREEKAKKYLK
jgi:hypothetical protein